jgi:hypothetical protein
MSFLALAKGQPPVKLYFDKDSGLLVRMVHYADTPLGFNPTQVDFADYRESAASRLRIAGRSPAPVAASPSRLMR